ncbi:hypothetical protein IV38_GL001176 [Lactobacillus selangorensis]|uniref:Uncharacterized protein n=1 Tax=Lactobacillus selangorensis TaxID=81857 RepID=A0A0R2FK06_9LACO|nr:hypothetical protein [Lactobacillus selangorensis]KRN28963.1 hypothetical protein IV38_GL001176 [Lactobacillus selangorensis]KRN32627.1 hypothetical protein IV40_GL000677 [Lactobacillus selangorensis]
MDLKHEQAKLAGHHRKHELEKQLEQLRDQRQRLIAGTAAENDNGTPADADSSRNDHQAVAQLDQQIQQLTDQLNQLKA